MQITKTVVTEVPTIIVIPSTSYETIVSTTKGKPTVSTYYTKKVITTSVTCTTSIPGKDTIGTITKPIVTSVTKTSEVPSTITQLSTTAIVTKSESKTTVYGTTKVTSKSAFTTCVAGPKGYFV